MSPALLRDPGSCYTLLTASCKQKIMYALLERQGRAAVCISLKRQLLMHVFAWLHQARFTELSENEDLTESVYQHAITARPHAGGTSTHVQSPFLRAMSASSRHMRKALHVIPRPGCSSYAHQSASQTYEA